MSRTNGSSGAMVTGSRDDARDGRSSLSNGQRPRTQKQGPRALCPLGHYGGRYWIRTSDPADVNRVL
jgi:hypothetical protein